MRKYFLLIILAAFIACSDDDVNPDEYTFQSVLDFDAGKFPTKIGDTVRYEGIVTINPIDERYDAAVRYDAYMLIARYQFDGKLIYSIDVNFNDEIAQTFPTSFKKGIENIDGISYNVVQSLNSDGAVTRNISEFKFGQAYGEVGGSQKHKAAITYGCCFFRFIPLK